MPDTDSQPSGQSQMDIEPTKRKEEFSITLQTFFLSLHSWRYKLQAAITYSPLQKSLCKISWKGAKAVRKAS